MFNAGPERYLKNVQQNDQNRSFSPLLILFVGTEIVNISKYNLRLKRDHVSYRRLSFASTKARVEYTDR